MAQNIRTAATNTGYLVVGLGVVGAQQARFGAESAAEKVGDFAGRARDAAIVAGHQTVEKITPSIDGLRARVEPAWDEFRAQAGGVWKEVAARVAPVRDEARERVQPVATMVRDRVEPAVSSVRERINRAS